MVPKLFTQSVSCPSCLYPNYASFRFCQSCGYQRKVLVDVPASGSSVPLEVIALDTVFCRLLVFLLVPVMLSSRLPFKKGLNSQFLSSLPFPKDISTATPRELCRFLVWKDRKGKTTVHKSTCQFFGRKGSFSCLCPTRLAYGGLSDREATGFV